MSLPPGKFREVPTLPLWDEPREQLPAVRCPRCRDVAVALVLDGRHWAYGVHHATYGTAAISCTAVGKHLCQLPTHGRVCPCTTSP